MVSNKFIQCNACKMKIQLRIQMGFFDIPFHIHCPKCDSTISGKIFIEEKKINVEGADIVGVECNDEEFYSVELSAEFPTRKIIHKKINEIELSPFIRYCMMGGNLVERTTKTMLFAKFIKYGLSDMKQNFELLWNNQEKVLFAKTREKIKKNPCNILDAVMILHQFLITQTGISSVIGEKCLEEYIKIGKLIIEETDYISQIVEFIVENQIDFNGIEKKGFKLIELFAKAYEQLIPVIVLKDGDYLKDVDRKEYGIMTANFDELSDFYAKSYEWILDNLYVILGLNNIFVRNDSTKCVNGKTYQNFIKEAKGNRLKNGYIDEKEPFSRPINSLNNRVRNAIQHFDSDINYETQLIIFNDRNKQVELYLIDFADLCIENFRIIFYILEIVYDLRKISLIQDGNVPIFAKSKVKKDK